MLTIYFYGIFPVAHLIANPVKPKLYGKLPGNYFTQIGNLLFPDLKKNVLAHKIWMVRSYSMAMTAVTFRIYHILFFMLDWGHLENYELSL